MFDSHYHVFTCPHCSAPLDQGHRLSLARSQPCPKCGAQVVRSTHSVANGWLRTLMFPIFIALWPLFLGVVIFWIVYGQGELGYNWLDKLVGIGVMLLASGIGAGILGFALSAAVAAVAGFLFWTRWYHDDLTDFEGRGSAGFFTTNALGGALLLAALAIAIPWIENRSTAAHGFGDKAMAVLLTLASAFVVVLGFGGLRHDRRPMVAVAAIAASLFALGMFAWTAWRYLR